MLYVLTGILITALGYLAYKYGKQRKILDRTRELNHELVNVTKELGNVLQQREEELEVLQQNFIEMAMESGNADDAADMFNQLLSHKNSTGEMPN